MQIKMAMLFLSTTEPLCRMKKKTISNLHLNKFEIVEALLTLTLFCSYFFTPLDLHASKFQGAKNNLVDIPDLFFMLVPTRFELTCQ